MGPFYAENNVIDSLSEAVEQVWAQVASGEARTVSEAVDQLWPVGLEGESMEAAARAGLISIAHGRQGDTRRASTAPIGWGAPHGKQWAGYLLTLSQPFEDATGREKPLLDFDSADLLAFELRCDAIAKGWRSRRQVALAARQLLGEHGAARVRDLPEEVQRDLASQWEQVWS